jgi:hypothetical protein
LRAAAVAALRQDFKRSRFERAGSGFGDDGMILMMLSQFLNGMLDRKLLWKVLQEQQRYRPQQSNPTFGSGGFGHGSVWGGGDAHGIGRRGGFGGGVGGGGFRTGGGF